MKFKFLKPTLCLLSAMALVGGINAESAGEKVVAGDETTVNVDDVKLVSFNLRRGSAAEPFKLHIQLDSTSAIYTDYANGTNNQFISQDTLKSQANLLDYITFETWSGQTVKLSEVAASSECYGHKIWGDTAPFIQLGIGKFGGETAPYKVADVKGFRILAGCEFPSVDGTKKFVSTNTWSGTFANGSAVDGKFSSHTPVNTYDCQNFGHITKLTKVADTTAEVKVDNGNATFGAIWISTPEYAGIDANTQKDYYNKAFALQGDFTLHFFDKILVDGYRLSDEAHWGVGAGNPSQAQLFYQTRFMIGIPMPTGFSYKGEHTITLEKGLELPHWETTSVFMSSGEAKYFVNTRETTTYNYNGQGTNNVFNGYSKVEELTLTGISGNLDKQSYGANIQFASPEISTSFDSTDIYECEGFVSNIHYYGEDGAEITLTPRNNTRLMYNSGKFLIQLDPSKELSTETGSLVKKVVVKKGAWLPSYEMFTTNTGVKYVTAKDYTFYYRSEIKQFLTAENVVESGNRISTSVVKAAAGHNAEGNYYNVELAFSAYDGDANANTEPVTVGTKAMIVREQIKCYDTNGDLIKDISIRDQVFNCIWNSHFLVQIPYAGEIAKIVLPKGSLIPSKAMVDTGTGCYYVTDADAVIYETGAATYQYASTFISKVDAAMALGYTYTDTDGVYSEVDFRLFAGINKAAMDTVLAKAYSANATFGIEVTDGTKTVKATGETLHEKDGMYYTVIDLGDVLNDTERAEVEFTVRAYVTDNDVTVFSAQTKTYSVKSLVAAYAADQATAGIVANLNAILNPVQQ